MRHSIRNLGREYPRHMDTGFGSGKPWSPAYSPTADYILTKRKPRVNLAGLRLNAYPEKRFGAIAKD